MRVRPSTERDARNESVRGGAVASGGGADSSGMRQLIVPVRGAVELSQYWVKSSRRLVRCPDASYVACWIVNDPWSSLQPRLSPTIHISGPLGPSRVASAKVVPDRRDVPGAAWNIAENS